MNLMKRPLQLIRLFNINLIIFRNRLDTVVFSTKALQPFSFLTYFNPWYWLNGEKPRGESIRIALEELGPVFVKFGQILSTRRDLLPEDIADELEKLQDQVAPFSSEIAKKILEDHYRQPVDHTFLFFDIEPLASASIAQVHAATLKNGKQVVVKIVRPGIEKIIQHDISLLYTIATLTQKLVPNGNNLRLKEVVAEVERSMRYELDLLHEGANASQLRRNFANSSLLYVPEVYWEYSSRTILVMERINGIAISNVVALKQQGIHLKKLAEKGVEIFFTQVLRDSFFHADMHPGNIFVSKDNPIDPQYIAVDFGIMGTLSPLDQRYLAENLLAFFQRDYRRVAELHIESGWIGGQVRVDEFETAIRGVCEPIFERPLKDISFGKLLIKLFQAAREFNMQIQPQFFLLQKTLLNIEGLGRQLYPELDLWSTAKPFIEKWVREQMGPRALIKRIQRKAPLWIDKMIDMPDLIHQALRERTTLKNIPVNSANAANKNTKRKKWLGVGFGLLIATSFSHFLTYASIQTLQLANFSIFIIGLILILINF